MKAVYIRHGDDYNDHTPLATPRTAFSRVEIKESGLVIADGVALDLRGARRLSSVSYPKVAITEGWYSEVTLLRDIDGEYEVEVIDTSTGANSSESEVDNITTFPYAIVGAHSQSVDSVHPDSVTQETGLRRAFRNAHDQFLAWGAGLNELAPFYPQSIVNAGHDWLYWGGHVASYMVAHDSNLSFEQKANWAEEVVAGADGVTNPAEFYADTSAHTAPTAPITWYDPVNNARKSLSAVVSLAGSTPSISDLQNGGWVDSLTV